MDCDWRCGCPSRPRALTLTLSRPAGEGTLATVEGASSMINFSVVATRATPETLI